MKRLRTWWHGLPLMRVFFCYAAIWLVAAAVVTVLGISVLMDAYYAYEEAADEVQLEVNSGPYIYDEAADELVPATQVYLNGDLPDQIVFLGFTNPDMLNQRAPSDGADGQSYAAHAVYATMELVRSDPNIRISDWGGNYTEEAYRATGGNPYTDEPLDPAELPAYDARERAARVATDGLFSTGSLGEDVIVSNVGYYVLRNRTVTPVGFALRILAGVVLPVVSFGGLAFVLFRRFYRERIGAPLRVLDEAAERISAQDLDFSIGQVEGRELGRLATSMETMRGSLEAAQRALWRTAEDRRRLNAAFAHDLRTPVTVLKGTIEMMRLHGRQATDSAVDDSRIAVPASAVETLASQTARLEAYAQAMTGLTKLEDRAVSRAPVAPDTVATTLRAQADEIARARDTAIDVSLVCGPTWPAASAEPLEIDLPLVCEVAENLVANACEHARASVIVRLDLERADAGEGETEGDALLVLAVQDDGPGFSPEALHRGCDPFFSERKSAEHFGLGLNIVRTLATLHGGEVTVENDPAGGACVRVTFAMGYA